LTDRPSGDLRHFRSSVARPDSIRARSFSHNSVIALFRGLRQPIWYLSVFAVDPGRCLRPKHLFQRVGKSGTRRPHERYRPRRREEDTLTGPVRGRPHGLARTKTSWPARPISVVSRFCELAETGFATMNGHYLLLFQSLKFRSGRHRRPARISKQ
jgi:hypothetical protein